MKFSELASQLGSEMIACSLTKINHLDPDIQGIAAIDEAETGTLSYIEGAKFASYLKTTNASALILPMDETMQNLASERGIGWLSSKEPRLLFAQAMALFYRPFQPTAKIHSTSVVHPTAKVGKNVYLGAHVLIVFDYL